VSDLPKTSGALSLRAAPNPLSSSTRISFVLNESQNVALLIFDVGGALVHTLHQGALPQGPHEFVWRGVGAHGIVLRPSVYFLRLEVGSEVATEKLVLLR
jgi:hypothetical protein